MGHSLKYPKDEAMSSHARRVRTCFPFVIVGEACEYFATNNACVFFKCIYIYIYIYVFGPSGPHDETICVGVLPMWAPKAPYHKRPFAFSASVDEKAHIIKHLCKLSAYRGVGGQRYHVIYHLNRLSAIMGPEVPNTGLRRTFPVFVMVVVLCAQ
jgi:hypothetical protein